MKSIQTVIYRKIRWIDFRLQIIKSEYELFLYDQGKKGLKIYRDKVKHYLKELRDIERNYNLYPNNRKYLIKLKYYAVKELKEAKPLSFNPIKIDDKEFTIKLE